MEVTGSDGTKPKAKKRTSVMTNSKHLADVLRQAQRGKSHRHEQLVGGKAKQCEVYPKKFARLICAALKREIADAKWRKRIADNFEIGPALEKLMAVQEKLSQEAYEETPHEAGGSAKFHELYEGQEFVDDVSGIFLNKELGIQARKLEIDFFKNRGV